MCFLAHGYKLVHETEQQGQLCPELHWLQNHVFIFWRSMILAQCNSQGSGGPATLWGSEQGPTLASLRLSFPISETTFMSPHCPLTSPKNPSQFPSSLLATLGHRIPATPCPLQG